MRRKEVYDLHHAYPRSRFPEHANAVWNFRSVRKRRHQAYHLLVENKTPCEAALALLKEFGPDVPGDLESDPGLMELLKFLDRCWR